MCMCICCNRVLKKTNKLVVINNSNAYILLYILTAIIKVPACEIR